MSAPPDPRRSAPTTRAIAVYRVGDLLIDPAQGYVRRAGDDIYLRQQTLQVLHYLLAHRDRVVGKEELREAIWGDVAVTDDALVQCVVDIRRALGDDSRAPHLIKTIPRLGYRFVAPVEIVEPPDQAAPRAIPDQPAPVSPSSVEREVRGTRIPRLTAGIAAAVLVALVVVAIVARSRSGSSPETSVSPAAGVRQVAVFLFENQSGSREFAWLQQGLADMVITDLSRFEGLAVVSRQQLDPLLARNGLDAQQKIDLERALQIGRASAADAIVMGTFAELGGTIRLEASLVDVATGRVLAAETGLAEKPQEVLTQIDVVALRLARRLGVTSGDRDAGGSLADVMTANLEAYHYYVLGLQKSNALESAEAIALFEKAIAIDPEFAMAYARIGYSYAITHSIPESAKPFLQRAYELSERLTEKDRLSIAAWYAIASLDYEEAIRRLKTIVSRYPLEVETYWRLGVLLQAEGRTEEARTVLHRGLAADPENKQIANSLGTLYQLLARHRDAITMHRRYVELAPKEPNAHDSLGLTYQYAGMYEDAIEAYGRAIALDPDFEIARIHLGNTFYQLGRYRDAIQQYRRYVEAADFDADRKRGYAAIAWVMWRQGRRAEARDHEDRSMTLAGHTTVHHVLLSLRRDDLPQVRAYLDSQSRFLGRGSGSSKRIDLFMRGELALAEGRGNEALDHFRAALLHPPLTFSNDSYDDCLASGLLRLKRFEEAIAEYRRVLGINARLASAQYGLAQALDEQGQAAEAAAEYQRFLEIWKNADADVPEFVNARRRLAPVAPHN